MTRHLLFRGMSQDCSDIEYSKSIILQIDLVSKKAYLYHQWWVLFFFSYLFFLEELKLNDHKGKAENFVLLKITNVFAVVYFLQYLEVDRKNTQVLARDMVFMSSIVFLSSQRPVNSYFNNVACVSNCISVHSAHCCVKICGILNAFLIFF